MSLLQIAEPGQGQMKESCRRRVVGIDLGTTHSLIASVVNQIPMCLPDEKGQVLLPSVVQYRLGKAPLVGEEAFQTLALAPFSTITSVKRFMGRTLKDIPKELENRYQFGTDEKVIRFRVASKEVTPVEVSAEILRVLRSRAEQAFGGLIEGAVITVPAYFDEGQRQATKDAGRLAGLLVLRLLNEPTAAALAYGLDKKVRGTFAVYDLGGGTFDISILDLSEGVFSVLSTSGDTSLGGDDMDQALAEWVVKNHPRSLELQKTLGKNQALWAELLLVCRKVKHDLTQNKEAYFPGVGSFTEPVIVTEEQFSLLIQDLLERTTLACKRALQDAELTIKDIEGVILVGGATRVPSVRRHVEKFFGKQPLSDVDPDQVVALGAAIQAEMIANQKEDVVLLDVTPLSLGLELMGGVVEKIIPRNSRIPTVARQIFTTYAEGQTGFDLHIVQGERDQVAYCRSLARFQLAGISKMAAGMARLEVLFLVDENGLLQVTAKELTSGKEAHIQVEPSYGLTETQVENMLLESYEHAEEDIAYRSLAEQKVEAKSIVFILRKALQEDAFLLSPPELTYIEQAIEKLNKALLETNSKDIETKLHELEKASREFTERRMNQGLQKIIAGQTVQEVEEKFYQENMQAPTDSSKENFPRKID